jgi:hypothetical protein
METKISLNDAADLAMVQVGDTITVCGPYVGSEKLAGRVTGVSADCISAMCCWGPFQVHSRDLEECHVHLQKKGRA